MSAVQEPTSVIVYGPQGSGKSLLGEDLRAHFGLQQIVEAEEFIGQWPRHGALILTSDNPTEWPGTGGVTAVHIADAMHALGRIAPIDIAARIAGVPVDEVQKLVRSRRITVKRYRFRDDAGGSSIRQCVAPIDVIDAVRVATSAASAPDATADEEFTPGEFTREDVAAVKSALAGSSSSISAPYQRTPNFVATSGAPDPVPDDGRRYAVIHNAPGILRTAAQAIDDRAALRDCPGGERSMARCVEAFNAMFADSIAANSGSLTVTQGWQFMELLKLARSVSGGHHLDDHIDRAAYAALAGEAAESESADKALMDHIIDGGDA